MNRSAVVVAIGRVPRVAALVVPHQLHDRPVDRQSHHPRRREHRLELLGRAVSKRGGGVHADGPHAVLGELALQSRVVGALGQPEAAAEASEAPLVRRHAGGHLEPQARVARQQREDGVGGRRGPQLHRAPSRQPRQRRHQLAPPGIECDRGALVIPPGTPYLCRQSSFASALEPLRVLVVHFSARLAQEGVEPIAGVARQRLELVTEDRGEPEGQGRLELFEQVEEREVHSGDGLPQPLLPERPGPKALHVRHVGVQDERESAAFAAHGLSGDGAGPSARGTSTQPAITASPTRMGMA